MSEEELEQWIGQLVGCLLLLIFLCLLGVWTFSSIMSQP